MPRNASRTDALIAELTQRIAALIESARAEGRESALADVRALLGRSGGPKRTVAGATGKRRGRPKQSSKAAKAPAPAAAAAKAAEPQKARKNPWAGLSPAARLARVNAIRVGRGLPPKPGGAAKATKSGRKTAARGTAKKSAKKTAKKTKSARGKS